MRSERKSAINENDITTATVAIVGIKSIKCIFMFLFSLSLSLLIKWYNEDFGMCIVSS